MKKRIIEIMCILLSFFILIPFYIVLVNSFKPLDEAAMMGFGLPKVWHALENYITVFNEAHILVAFRNSMIISTTSVVLIVVISSMAAFVIQRRSTKVTKTIFNIIMLGMIIPLNMVCTFFVMKSLHLTDSLLGMILVVTTVNLPVSTFIYVGYYKTIPKEIDEAAIVDGCNFIQMFFKVIFPLLKPATATVVIINFIAVWNDFNVSVFFLNSPDKVSMVMTQFLFMGSKASDWNLVFADVVLCSIPMIIIFIIFQKQIIKGMTSGSVKG